MIQLQFKDSLFNRCLGGWVGKVFRILIQWWLLLWVQIPLEATFFSFLKPSMSILYRNVTKLKRGKSIDEMMTGCVAPSESPRRCILAGTQRIDHRTMVSMCVSTSFVFVAEIKRAKRLVKCRFLQTVDWNPPSSTFPWFYDACKSRLCSIKLWYVLHAGTLYFANIPMILACYKLIRLIFEPVVLRILHVEGLREGSLVAIYLFWILSRLTEFSESHLEKTQISWIQVEAVKHYWRVANFPLLTSASAGNWLWQNIFNFGKKN